MTTTQPFATLPDLMLALHRLGIRAAAVPTNVEGVRVVVIRDRDTGAPAGALGRFDDDGRALDVVDAGDIARVLVAATIDDAIADLLDH